MKRFFDTQIKPMNDQLAKELRRNENKISVMKISGEYEIPVRVTFTSQQGNQVTFSSIQIKSYRALGLRI